MGSRASVSPRRRHWRVASGRPDSTANRGILQSRSETIERSGSGPASSSARTRRDPESRRRATPPPLRRSRRFGVPASIALALGALGLAWALEHAISEYAGFQPLIVFHAATAAVTWLAGAWYGVVVAILSFFLAERFYVPFALFDGLVPSALALATTYWIAAIAVVLVLSSLRRALAEASSLTHRAERLAVRVQRKNAEAERVAALYRALHEAAAALVPAMTPAQVHDVSLGAGAAAAGAAVALAVRPDGAEAEVAGGAGCPGWVQGGVRTASSPAVERVLAGGPPEWLASGQLLPDAAETDPCGAWAVLPLAARDRRLGALVLGYQSGDVSRQDQTSAQLLAQQVAQALDRVRLYQAERAARVRAQFAERRLGFLATASAGLSATLDTGRSLAEIADLAATNLGDLCVIHVVDEAGDARLAAGSATTATGLLRFGGDEGRYVLDAGAGLGYPAVLRSGEPELLTDVDETMLRQAAGAAGSLDRLLALGLRSQICVPLVARDVVLGTITVGSTAPGRRMTSAELTLIEDLARRIAQALDNARLYRAALQASRAKSSFLAVMSHELRTPLNAILGYADLILMGIPAAVTEPTQRQVERIKGSASHLLELVDDVLSFARVEAGRDRVHVASVLLDEVLGEAVGMVMPLVHSKRLSLHQDIPRDVTLHTDPGKLVRILHNLLSNAAKFTAEGRIDVVAKLDADIIEIDVCDTGIGIPPDQYERVFDPFWQVEEATARRFGGTGIGLGIARQLARLLGGDLTVRSEIGRGSIFMLRIPIRYEVVPPPTT